MRHRLRPFSDVCRLPLLIIYDTQAHHPEYSGGMIAPMLGGVLLMINRSVPVYTSVAVFAVAGIAVLLLREGAGDGKRTKGERVVVH